MSATAFPTWKLLTPLGNLHNRGCTLYADNWFTGMKTISTVQEMGIDYVGTCKTNRTGGACKDTRAFFKKAKRGKYRVEKQRSNDLWATQWQDKKVVTIMSTHPGPVGKIFRKTVDKNSGAYTPSWYPCPAIVSAYNKGKVGTDRMDQMVASYYKNRRMRWHLKVLQHISYIAAFNAFTTWKEYTKSKSGILDFLESLVRYHGRAAHKARKDNKDKHTPMMPVNKRDSKRNRCVECVKHGVSVKVGTYCKECGVYLHLDSPCGTLKCWSSHLCDGWQKN